VLRNRIFRGNFADTLNNQRGDKPDFGLSRASMKDMRTTRKCRKCAGTGKEPLTLKCDETLSVLKRNQPISGTRLARLLGIKASTANNLLTALGKMGLAEGIRNGPEILWRSV
jgi:hypothetical protein